jgi:ribokinase
MVSRDAIIVLGDINVDVMGVVDRWPQPGDDCLANRLEIHLGGVGANYALALSRWGVRTRLFGCVGRDEFGSLLRRTLRENGLDVRWLQTTTEAMTGLVYINVTPDGQRTFFGSRGANMIVRKPQRPRALFDGAGALHLAGYNFLTPVTEATARFLHKSLRKKGALVSLDVGPDASRLFPRKVLQLASQIDILFANLSEAYALTRERDPRSALRSLHNAGATDVVLKLGKDGCMIFHEGEVMEAPAFPIDAVDSTGAGDAFVGAFLQARLRGWSQPEAAVAANAAGAAATKVLGAGENLPHLQDIVGILQTPLADREWDSVRRAVLSRLQFEKIRTAASGTKKKRKRK